MPIYDYACPNCGGFAAFVPLARYDQPEACPACGAASPRASLSVPMLAVMDGGRRRAHAVNEKSAFSPERSAESGRHPSGCGCCRPASKGMVPGGVAPGSPAPGGALKSFPGARPWMIGH